MLFPLPDKHLANVSLDRMHTTRRAQVLAQDVAEHAADKNEQRRTVECLTKPEKVFQLTSPKPIETTTTFPESLINSDNSFDMFLGQDPQKLLVFKNFRNLNRDLTKAYLRQAETQSLFEKAKGGALPEHQIKQKQQDDETFGTLGMLFDTMRKRSKYGPAQNGARQAYASVGTSIGRLSSKKAPGMELPPDHYPARGQGLKVAEFKITDLDATEFGARPTMPPPRVVPEQLAEDDPTAQ